jgi:signal transduction histidine kinase
VEGNGLGLAIVKSIAEQHGGQVSVESEQDQGSYFHVSLPLLTAAEYVLPEPSHISTTDNTR